MKHLLNTRLLVVLAAGLATPPAHPAEQAAAKANYERTAEPTIAPAFLVLPLGAVEPTGWLRDWAVTAREGITGHLDERHPVFRDGWKGIPIAWSGANADGTGWPLEQSAYWMDGALRLGFVLHDEPLVRKIRARLDPIVEGVNAADPGTSFIYWKKGYRSRGFDNWAHSQMGRTLVALYQGAGEPRVLEALVKVYADYPANLGGLDFGDVSGLCNLDAMMETYALSGNRRILASATAAINPPAVRQLIGEWVVGKVRVGHLVITYENTRLPAVMYPWTGDPALLQATKGALHWLDTHHRLPYGLASGEETAAGIGAARKTETCNLPAMLLSCTWLYRLEGDGAWGDRMEQAFFNGGPAPWARDGQTAAYYQSPNRIRLGQIPVESTAPSEMGGSGIAFGPLACERVLCCIGALNRILPYYIAHMWMATRDNGLAATLYGPCRVNARAGAGVPIQITCTTDYPFNETLRLRLEPARPVDFPLYLRFPGWCAAPAVEVNGRRARTERAPGKPGFVRLRRTWRAGDTVTLNFPMAVRIERGLEGPYPSEQRGYFRQIPDSLFHPRALPYASVTCGPLLFALPIPEQDPNTPAEGAKWQYALDCNPAEAGKLRLRRGPMPARWDWPLAAPLSLPVPVRAFAWQPTIAQALPEAPVTGDAPATVSLIPYGCTKFHISMFPVTLRTWAGEPQPPKSPNPER